MITQEDLNNSVSNALSANMGRMLTGMIDSNIQRTVKEELKLLSLDASLESKRKRENLLSGSIIIEDGIGNKVIHNIDEYENTEVLNLNDILNVKDKGDNKEEVKEYIDYSLVDSFKLRLLSYISIKIKNEYLNDKIFEYVIEIRNKYIKRG